MTTDGSSSGSGDVDAECYGFRQQVRTKHPQTSTVTRLHLKLIFLDQILVSL